MRLTLEEFWLPLLKTSGHRPTAEIKGWFFDAAKLSTFIEAPLSLNSDLSTDGIPEIIMVSAPGAVGKSTLAKEISARTGMAYIDLARADAVGANTISGGLAKSGLFSEWANGEITVLIDGLDEARLRVTQEAFQAFLEDVASLCINRIRPIILFGRTGAVHDAWVILSDLRRVRVLEIGYYDQSQAHQFILKQIELKSPGFQHEQSIREAIEITLQKIQIDSKAESAIFSGYAPVLQAVAERISKENNPRAFISSIEKGEQPVTLYSVAMAILDREHKKIASINFEDTKLATQLYTAEEQLKRLAAQMFGALSPPLPQMGPNDAQKYDTALTTWVPDHPFLDGRSQPSSAVFEAIILATALCEPSMSHAAVRKELARGAAANPFLIDFYLAINGHSGRTIPPEHIGVLYLSVRARLAIGETATLIIDAEEDSSDTDDTDALNMDVEIITTRRPGNNTNSIELTSTQIGTIYLGPHLDDVQIAAQRAEVEIGTGSEVTIVSPVYIECGKLVFNSNKLIVEPQIGGDRNVTALIAHDVNSTITAVPVLRGMASLSVSWPDANIHPWTNFAQTPPVARDTRLDEALRRFCKFIVAFRSHSKGQLARYKDKLNHERMTKGPGRAVLDLFIKSGIITSDETMYYLDPDKLGHIAGTKYADCISKKFDEKTIEFVAQALLK